MRIRLNGEPRDLESGTTIERLLRDLDLPTARLAVERNGDVVPRAAHAGAVLEDGDVVEVVRFVGGG
ncbi:MAG TPA: sulfur carrier protein ThiS [Candidatus Polarisedimenticolia bacterium]|nr:sulfur carrier protein ThiS [Candidatus Polarisedimenticolia bacterium]